MRQRTTAGRPSAKQIIEAGEVGRHPRWGELPGVKKKDKPEAHLSNPKQTSKGEFSEVHRPVDSSNQKAPTDYVAQGDRDQVLDQKAGDSQVA